MAGFAFSPDAAAFGSGENCLRFPLKPENKDGGKAGRKAIPLKLTSGISENRVFR